jgi:hypothetical protein
MAQNNGLKNGINLDQVYKLLVAGDTIADTKAGYAAFKNLVKCPVVSSNGTRRPCRLEEDKWGNVPIHRIEVADGRLVITYLEAHFAILKGERIARNKYEFTDILSWIDGDSRRLENLNKELGSIGRAYAKHWNSVYQTKKKQQRCRVDKGRKLCRKSNNGVIAD